MVILVNVFLHLHPFLHLLSYYLVFLFGETLADATRKYLNPEFIVNSDVAELELPDEDPTRVAEVYRLQNGGGNSSTDRDDINSPFKLSQ